VIFLDRINLIAKQEAKDDGLLRAYWGFDML
jgi:hypothetical protein